MCQMHWRFLLGVCSRGILSINVTTVMHAIAGDAMMMKELMITHAVDAMSNVAMIAGSNGIGRDSCTAALRRYQTECVGSRT